MGVETSVEHSPVLFLLPNVVDNNNHFDNLHFLGKWLNRKHKLGNYRVLYLSLGEPCAQVDVPSTFPIVWSSLAFAERHWRKMCWFLWGSHPCVSDPERLGCLSYSVDGFHLAPVSQKKLLCVPRHAFQLASQSKYYSCVLSPIASSENALQGTSVFRAQTMLWVPLLFPSMHHRNLSLWRQYWPTPQHSWILSIIAKQNKPGIWKTKLYDFTYWNTFQWSVLWRLKTDLIPQWCTE